MSENFEPINQLGSCYCATWPSVGGQKYGEMVQEIRLSPKRKRERSDSVLWQKPLHQQKCQKGKVTTQTTPQKSSITQRLRTDLGWSVGVTTATQLVWFTGLRAHLPTNYDKSPYTYRKLKVTIQQNATNNSITQILRTERRWSVEVMSATKLVWLNRFTESQPSH